MGSTMKAQVFGVMASRKALESPKGITLNPGVNGPKPSRYCSSVEKLTMEMVPAVEVIGADDDFRLVLRNAFNFVAPFARGFQRGFDGFGAGIHGQCFVEAGQIVEILIKKRKLLIAESARGKRHLLCLLGEGTHNAGMAVALVDGGIRGQAIEIAAAFNVVYPNAIGAFNDDIKRVVVVRSVLVFELYKFGRA